MDVFDAMIGFDGRIGRSTWWIGNIVLLLAIAVLTVGLLHVISKGRWLDLDYGDDARSSVDSGLASLILMVTILYPSLALSIRRFHDLDVSGAWCVALFALSFLYPAAQFQGLTGSLNAENTLGKWLFRLGIAVMIVWIAILGFVPGTSGPNTYGVAPV